MKCPKCGSENCQFHTKTELKGSLFSLKDACCGSICLGPLGILCGLCGTSIDTTTKEFWVCNDCGNQFKAGGILYDIKNSLETSSDPDIKEQKKQMIKFIFENEENYIQYTENEMVQRFEQIIESGRHAGCMEKIIYQDDDLTKYSKLLKKYARYSLVRDNVLFIFGKDNNIIVTLQGIYAGEAFYRYQNNGAIISYENNIYFNQICIKFDSEEEKEDLFSLLMEILPEENFCKEYEFENLLRILQGLPDQSYLNENHFRSQKNYAGYVNKLRKEKLREYISNSRNKKLYREYKSIHEKREKEENLITAVGIVISIIVAIRYWIVESWLSGLVVGVIGMAVSMIIVAVITESKKWNRYKDEFLPEKLILLLDESESSVKTGKIKPDDYQEDFSESYKDVMISEKNVCPKCGYSIPRGAKWCPVCGEKVKKC